MKRKKLRVNDKVMVIAGKDKDKIGTVKKILTKSDQVVVENVNMIKKHAKGNPYSGKSGVIQEKEAPIHFSNVALVCNSCAKPTRIGYTYTSDNKKYRYCKKCNEILD